MQTTTIKGELTFEAGDSSVDIDLRENSYHQYRHYDDDNFSKYDSFSLFPSPRRQQRSSHELFTSVRTTKSILIPPTYEEEEKKGNNIQIDQYFGPTARSNCNERYHWLKNQTNLLINDDELLNITRFDPSKKSALDFPFNPHRHDDEYSDDDELVEENDQKDDNTSTSTIDRSLVKYDVENGCPTSPRTKFLAGCIKNKLNPRISLILRKRVTDELNLQHLGIGDEMGLVFAQSLKDLPIVRTINLADNNLTDQSLGVILEAITALPDLTYLDLSNNTLDSVTSKALANYLSSPECILKRLKLSSADLDDNECQMFVQALQSNKILEELDLSKNKIGQAENLNTVKPDIITGGESLATLLSSNTCSLKQLNLGWNMIRLDGACALASSLAYNQYLTHLDLSYNGLGREAGELLGNALLTNQTIESLLLMNNNLNFSACFTLCVAVEENHSLKRLQLDGNPIGEGGARILMTVPSTVGGRVKVSANGCNILMKDVGSKFDMTSPDGMYELDMSIPYERAIAFKLLRLIACHETYVFHRFAYLPNTFEPIMPTEDTQFGYVSSKNKKPGNPFRKMIPNIPVNALEVNLEKVYSNEKAENLDDQQIELLRSLREVESAANNLEIAQRLFAEYDTDGSGSLDRVELHSLLTHVGLKMEMAVFEQAVDMFDIDGSGTLELDEFLGFLKSQKEEAASRIRDILEFPVMVRAGQPASERYVPPTSGKLFILVGDSYTNRGHKVISVVDHANMMEVVNNGMDNVATVIMYCIQNVKLRLNEAIHIFHALHKEIPDLAKVVAIILPRMVNPNEARSFMMQVINFDRVALNRLQETLGNSLYPIIGIYNGYYDLNLSDENDRICLAKLLAQSQYMKDEMMKRSIHKNGTTSDLSQIGDWSSFRNERINNIPIRLTVELFNPMPKEGLVSFDFSGDDKPKYGSIIMKDAKCINLILNLGLVEKKDKNLLENDIKKMTNCIKYSLPGDGHYRSINDNQRAEDIQLCMCKFYSRLELRSEEYIASKVLEQELIRDHDFMGHLNQTNHDDDDDDEEDEDEDDKSRHSDDSIESLSHFVFEEEEKREIDRQSSVPDELIEMTTLTRSQQIKALTAHSNSERRGALQSGVALRSPSILSSKAIPPSTSNTNRQTRLGRKTILPMMKSSPSLSSSFSSFSSLPSSPSPSPSTPTPTIKENETSSTLRKQQLRITNSRKFVYQSSQSLFKLKKNVHTSYNAKCAKIVNAITDIITRVYIQAHHLALIIKWFRLGRTHKTRHFGTYRVELIILLFSRIIDIHNIDLVLAELSSFEVACLYCRLGILNLFNPLKPEGSICLDLSRHDERIVAKILALLSTIEPGENWLDESFRWEYSSVPVPGWELTQTWMTDAGMPRRGFLFLRYYCGDGERINGCRAEVIMRKALLCLVKIDEVDYLNDEFNLREDGTKIHNLLIGINYAKQYKPSPALWDYIAPFNSTSARIFRGEKFEDVFGDHYDAVEKIFTRKGPVQQQANSLSKLPKTKASEKSTTIVVKKNQTRRKQTKKKK